jgi:hypothetical protein
VGISTIWLNLCELPAWHLLFQLRVLFPQFHRRGFIVLGVVFWIPPALASILPRLRIVPALCLNDWSDYLLLVYSLGKLLDIFGWCFDSLVVGFQFVVIGITIGNWDWNNQLGSGHLGLGIGVIFGACATDTFVVRPASHFGVDGA